METRGTSIKQVAQMNYMADERAVMGELDTLWLMTMDTKHKNILAYPLDIMVEHVEELAPRKYADMTNFFEYKAEDGSIWYVSKAMELQDMDMFFRNYFHLDEEIAA